MNQLKVIPFNGQLVTDSREVAEMVGKRHDHLLADIKKYVGVLDSQDFGSADFFISHTYTNSQNKVMPCYLLTRKGCDMVANKMTGEKGILFTATYVTKFEEMENFLKNNPFSGFTDEKKIAFETHLIGVEYTSKILNVDKTSKIKMLEEAHKHHGVPTNHLPQYVDEEVTMSLTALLKKYDVKMATAKFNTKLIELGILEIKERPSSKGGVKEFKSITEKGLYYGKNLINPRNPKETQPHYYESKFSELIRMVVGEAA